MSKSLAADISVKGIIALTLPISLSRLIPELNFLFNGIFLGHLGTKELAYASLTGVFYLIFGVVGYALGNTVLTMISKYAGENKRDMIINTLRHGYIIGFVFFVFGVLSTYVFLEPILKLLDIKPIDIIAVVKFMKIRIWGLMFLMGYQLASQYLICIKETNWLMIVSLIEAFANVIFDYWFIFGGAGLQSMGFMGAAYASVLAEFIGFASIMIVIVSNKFSLKYDIPETWKYSKDLLVKLFNQAYPLIAQCTLSVIIWWIFYILVARNFGYMEQAASQTMRNLFGLSGVFSWAFGSTTNSIISKLIGQGDYGNILKTIKRILWISCSGMLIFVLLVNISPSFLFRIYGQNDPAFIEIGSTLLRIVSTALIVLTAGIIWLNAAIASGESKKIFLIEVVAISTYLSYVYSMIEIFHQSIAVAWMSEWIYWTVIFILSYLFFKNWFEKEMEKRQIKKVDLN
jgi:multidrug resistance protein, MATE family